MEIKILASSSRGNCYHVTDGTTRLLLECGIPFAEIRHGLGFQVTGVAACLVSHEHKDHCKAVADVMKAGIDVFASAGTIEAVGLLGHRLHVIRAREQFIIGSWTILPFETQHDAAEPLGFLLANRAGEKLLYVTDTMYVRYRFQGLTHLMIECNYAADILGANVESGAVPVEMKRRIIRSHMSLETCLDFLRANDLSQVREVWLLHCSSKNSDVELFKREVRAVTGKPTFIAGDS